jgi:ABC-type spermidine/putrescine transport system permease subunit II
MANRSYFILLPQSVRLILAVVAAMAIALTAAPCIYAIIWTFWGTEVVGLLRPVNSPTMGWVHSVGADDKWTRAIWYSILLAFGSSTVSLFLIVMQGYCSRFAGVVSSLVFNVCALGVMLFPPIVFGLAYRFTVSSFGLPVWVALLLGHLVGLLPFQCIVFESSREVCSSEMLFAARSLGASHMTCLRTVYLPNVALSAFLAWTSGVFISFDEIVLAVFLIDGPAQTVPRRLWENAAQINVPTPGVIATGLMALLAVFSLTYVMLRRGLSR